MGNIIFGAGVASIAVVAISLTLLLWALTR